MFYRTDASSGPASSTGEHTCVSTSAKTHTARTELHLNLISITT